MKFTLLRQLTHSELGMFHEYRRQGREGSKQRAINFDGAVVDRVFPSAKDSDRINIGCVCLEDETTVVETKQWLKKQDKNWRFEGCWGIGLAQGATIGRGLDVSLGV